MMTIRIFILLPMFMLSAASTLAQDALKARPSPLAITAMRYKDTYVKITYSQPHKRGREIFGKLVPYGKVWRTGANEATEITLTHAILLNNILLKPGTYSLFTLPEKEKWTIIINNDLGLWGAYNYNPQQDVLRFEVPVHPIENVVYEPFTIQFDQQNDTAHLLMLWDKTKIAIPVKFINN